MMIVNEQYPFELKSLPYDYSALEPFIDTRTMQIHYNKHLKTYINNLNNILKDYPKLQSFSLEKLIRNNRYLPLNIRNDVKNNAGGVYNHSLYFQSMAPNAKHTAIGKLKESIDEEFYSFGEFLSKFKQVALNCFGSGYAWLLVDKLGKLSIKSSPNQDIPFNMQMSPVFLIDVWEHAYYLKYQNRRAEYIDNWFNLLNWEQAEVNFLKATKLRANMQCR